MNEFMICKRLTIKAKNQIENTLLKHPFSLSNLLVISSLVALLTTAGWLVFGFNGTVIEHAIHIGYLGCIPSTKISIKGMSI